MIMRVVLIVVIGSLMQAARSFVPGGDARFDGPAVTLAVGFILLIAFFTGRLFATFKLPRLTGYIAAGIVCGPAVLGLLTPQMVHGMRLANGVAISLIALTAGGEMNLREIRPYLRAITSITVIAVVGGMFALAGAVYLLRGMLPFFDELSPAQAVAVALVLGVTLSAQSPAVVVALRNEMGAEGPVTRTVLGVVVLADLVVIVCFAVASSYAQGALGAGGDASSTAYHVAWELFGSLGLGAVVGLLLTIYLRIVKSGAALFVLATCVVVAELSTPLHLDTLLVALAAGIFIQNVGRAGDRLLREIESASLPVYVVFFAVAGANIHLDVIPLVAVPAIVLVLTRASAFLVGARIATTLAGAPPEVRRWAGFGLLPQAGLALALALLFARTFPMFGEGASALTLGIVALNEIVAPIFFRWALVRSGEAGKLASGSEPPVAAVTPPGEPSPGSVAH